MQVTRIGIVGAGLSGLYAAYLLERRKIQDYVVLEARDVLGGRIVSAGLQGGGVTQLTASANVVSRFDLGPTWFWPEFQPQLNDVIDALELQRVEQYAAGKLVLEHANSDALSYVPDFSSSPISMRLSGGMAGLIEGLRLHLDAARIVTSQPVRHIHCDAGHVELIVGNPPQRINVDRVLLAVPPRIAASTIKFSPALPEALRRSWQQTPTWMASHAKYVAVYAEPFWRDQGLSGAARSAKGPLVEIHDASVPGGDAALFGFFGLPAQRRESISDEALRSFCRAQLTRLFGPRAQITKAEFIKEWATDPFTATAADRNEIAHRAATPLVTPGSGIWRDRIIGIGSEWSRQFPGYVAGAVEAASDGVNAVLPLLGSIASQSASMTCGTHTR